MERKLTLVERIGLQNWIYIMLALGFFGMFMTSTLSVPRLRAAHLIDSSLFAQRFSAQSSISAERKPKPMRMGLTLTALLACRSQPLLLPRLLKRWQRTPRPSSSRR
jgi:hypothetical protein